MNIEEAPKTLAKYTKTYKILKSNKVDTVEQLTQLSDDQINKMFKYEHRNCLITAYKYRTEAILAKATFTNNITSVSSTKDLVAMDFEIINTLFPIEPIKATLKAVLDSHLIQNSLVIVDQFEKCIFEYNKVDLSESNTDYDESTDNTSKSKLIELNPISINNTISIEKLSINLKILKYYKAYCAIDNKFVVFVVYSLLNGIDRKFLDTINISEADGAKILWLDASVQAGDTDASRANSKQISPFPEKINQSICDLYTYLLNNHSNIVAVYPSFYINNWFIGVAVIAKGFIPFGEIEFPKQYNGFLIKVFEGNINFCSDNRTVNPLVRNSKLNPGSCISTKEFQVCLSLVHLQH
mmetsp:Transcript_2123/g.1899  ORF Transcript_2123/g.1899 Transcript_2123/m.1899 type:complete len:354 (-) Transcript_2123:509-1570(-)